MRTKEQNRRYNRTAYVRHGHKYRAKYREWWAKLTPEQRWERNLLGTYGLSAAEYMQLLLKQEGCCAVCACRPPVNEKLVVDHNHETGEIRGLLDKRCNHLVGYIEKSPPVVVRNALAYLQLHDFAATKGLKK